MNSSLSRVPLAGLAFLMIFAAPLTAKRGWAAEANHWEIGAQAGPSFNDGDESFSQYEALLNYIVPWRLNITGDVDLGLRITSTAGYLRGGGDSGAIGTLGLEFVLGHGNDFQVRFGSAATGITEDEYGDEDLGTHLQFTSHIGANYRFWDELSARVRIQHMSNASLSDENPGVNIIMFGLHYPF